MVVYAWIARRLPDRWRARLAILALALPVAAHFGAGWKFVSRWSLTQITAATGGDQILVFDAKYAIATRSLQAREVSGTAEWHVLR